MSIFGKQLFSGVAYTAAAKYIGLIISLVVTGVLARILLPSEFGVVAIATIFIHFFSLISTMGFSPAIVQNKDINEEDLRNIYSFTFYLALISALAFALISPLIALFYEKEILTRILLLLSVNIFFSIINIVPNALFLKNKEFRFIAIRTLIVQSIIGVIAIAGALLGLGIYSLLVNPIIGSIIIFIISYKRYPIHFRWRFKKESIKKILSFSIYQFLFNISVMFYGNIDKLLMGKILGMAPLGYYEKSYRLMRLPLENIGHVISPVLHPLLSEYQNDISFIKSKYYTLSSLLAYIGFMLSAFLFFTSEELILLVFGKQWEPSVASFRIMSLVVGFLIVQSPIGSIYQSTNNTKGLFHASLYISAIMLVAVLLGLHMGDIEDVSVCITTAYVIAFIIYNLILHKQSLKSSLLGYLKLLIKPILISLLYALLLGLFSYFVKIDSSILSLLAKSLLSLMILFIFYKLKFLKEPLKSLRR